MEIICKYTVNDVASCQTVAFVWSEEVLVKQNINDYNLGYDKFTNITRVTSISEDEKGRKIFEFKPSGSGYNYIMFLDTSDEVVGFSRLQSQLDLDRYTIEKITMYLEIKVNDLGVQYIDYDYSYNIHIARTSEVHKKLFNTGYKNKTSNIDEINSIKEVDPINVQQLFEFRTTNERLLRYAGCTFLSDVQNETLTIKKLQPLKLQIPSSIPNFDCISIFKRNGEKCGIFRSGDIYRIVNFETQTVTTPELNNLLPQQVFGGIIITSQEIIDFSHLDENGKEIRVKYGSLKPICNHKDGTVYTASEDSKFISGRLLNLLLQNSYSQSVARIFSISDCYILYKQNRNYTLVSHGATVFVGELKTFVYITNKLFMAILTNGEYKVFELQYDRDKKEYSFVTIDLGYEYQVNNQTQYYFKYIEIFAKNRYSYPFINIQPFSFEGSLFTRNNNYLYSL